MQNANLVLEVSAYVLFDHYYFVILYFGPKLFFISVPRCQERREKVIKKY
jgi:hypothetical protein